MEVFVSDKESNRQYISSCKIGNFNGKEIEGEFCEIKSLEQHDAEVRKQERQKVITELEDWCDINEQYGVHNEKFIKDLRQKLNEMKGESDDN